MSEDQTELPDDDKKTRIPPATEFLEEYRGGQLDYELAQALATVAQAVRYTEKPGTVTVRFEMKPNRGSRFVLMSDMIKLKVPEEDREQSVFYVNDSGGLSRSDPYQDPLPFTVPVAEDAAAVALPDDSDAPVRLEDD